MKAKDDLMPEKQAVKTRKCADLLNVFNKQWDQKQKKKKKKAHTTQGQEHFPR